MLGRDTMRDAEVGVAGQRRHHLVNGYARWVVRLRWVVVLGWVTLAAGTTILLPSVTTAGSNDLGGLIPQHSDAVNAEKASLRDFAFPLLSNTAVVLRNPRRLPPLTQADVVLHAAAVDQRLAHLRQPYPKDQVLGALPVLNTLGIFPGAKESGTTAVTFLFFSPATSLDARARLAARYGEHFRSDLGGQVLVTGTVPARVQEARLLRDNLILVEVSTLAFVVLVVGLTFRSLVAPLLTVGTALLSYLVGVRLLGALGELTHIALPSELEPLIVALVLGILTDYSIFFLNGTRDRVRRGQQPAAALHDAIVDNTPIVAVAGLAVAAGTGSLYVANLQLFRAFGPGLAVSVVVGAAAALTLVPAALAILGTRVYWPSHLQPAPIGPRARRAASWWVRTISRRSGAAVAALLCVAALAAAAYPLTHVRLEISFIRSLPPDSPPRRGAAALEQGFARGLLAPTLVLVRDPRVLHQPGARDHLQELLAKSPGVAGVLGPATVPLPGAHDIFVSSQANEARYLVLLDNDPLGGPAIHDLRRLHEALPGLVARAGLPGAHVAVAGDTAIAAETVTATAHNLEVIAAVAFALEFVILALFLRALLAPLLLLASSALVVAAALGLTTFLFQDRLGSGGLTFYVPFATSVLLIALGSDYNVFGVGRIWEVASERGLRHGIRVALPETAKSITAAGITLAGSFALVALLPLLPFREVAFTMFVGLLLDAFVVRSILTPALLTLVGPASGWPGRRLRGRPDHEELAGEPA